MAKKPLSYQLRDGRGRFLKLTQLSRAKSVFFYLGKKKIAIGRFSAKLVLDKRRELSGYFSQARKLLVVSSKTKLPFKVTTRTITRKVFVTETVGTSRQPTRFNRNLNLKIKIHKHEPQMFSAETIKQVLLSLRKVHITLLYKRLLQLEPDQRRFIVRVLYTATTRAGSTEKAIGTVRFEAQTLDQLKFFMRLLRHKIRKRFQGSGGPAARDGYFQHWLPQTKFAFTGFTIENIESVSREFKGINSEGEFRNGND